MLVKGKLPSLLMVLTGWTCALVVGLFFMAGYAEALPVINVEYDYKYNGTDIMHTPEMANNTYGNFAIGPYGLKVNSVLAYYMCFDSAKRIEPPHSWTAVVATAADVAKYYFGDGQIAWEKTNLITWLASKWTPTSVPLDKQDLNKEMWEVTADYADLNVNGNDLSNRGGFYLQNANSSDQGDITRINGLLGSDKDHTGVTYDATFLLPVVQTTGSSWAFVGDNGLHYNLRTEVQPFVAPVPEPATLLLLGFGLAGLAGIVRRRNRQK